MTLTEEQRGALARAIDYINETDLPVGELDGFDREVLRNMVTTAINYGPDVMKMIELLAAGEHEQWADWAQSILDSEPGLSDGRKAAWPGMIATPYENLSEELKDKDRREVHLRSSVALDIVQQQAAEIERLRPFEIAARDLDSDLGKIAGERDEQSARIKELEADNQNLVTLNKSLMNNDWILRDNNRKYRKRAQKAELLNKELKADLEQSERVVEARLDVIDQQAAKIRELEDAAKPRAGLYGKYHLSKADGSPVDPGADYFVLRLDSDPVARRAALQYSYMTPDRTLAIGLQEKLTKYNPKMEDCINLQFFGMERPRVWQITDERKATLSASLKVLERLKKNNTDTDHSYLDRGITVLRDMLEEAEQ